MEQLHWLQQLLWTSAVPNEMFLFFLLLDLLHKKWFFICSFFCFLVHQEILRTVEITWKQLISQRRQALEDTYKMDLSVKGNDKERDMKITDITPLWEEIMTKAWQHLIGLCSFMEHIVVSKDIAVNTALNGKPLILWLYPSSAHHLPDNADSQFLPSRTVIACCGMPQPFCNHLVVLQGSCCTARKRNLLRQLYPIGEFKREDIWVKNGIPMCVDLQGFKVHVCIMALVCGRPLWGF